MCFSLIHVIELKYTAIVPLSNRFFFRYFIASNITLRPRYNNGNNSGTKNEKVKVMVRKTVTVLYLN